MLGELFHTWAERLAYVNPESRADLARAIDGTQDRPPAGITTLELDMRAVGLGGLWLFTTKGAASRREIEAAFGTGVALPRIAPDVPQKHMFMVAPVGAPYQCTVFVEYKRESADSDSEVRSVSFRIDRRTI